MGEKPRRNFLGGNWSACVGVTALSHRTIDIFLRLIPGENSIMLVVLMKLHVCALSGFVVDRAGVSGGHHTQLQGAGEGVASRPQPQPGGPSRGDVPKDPESLRDSVPKAQV